jgi:hypothetical protein
MPTEISTYTKFAALVVGLAHVCEPKAALWSEYA